MTANHKEAWRGKAGKLSAEEMKAFLAEKRNIPDGPLKESGSGRTTVQHQVLAPLAGTG